MVFVARRHSQLIRYKQHYRRYYAESEDRLVARLEDAVENAGIPYIYYS